MERCFVVVSGLPGSGKSTLARQLAPTLHLPLVDKDEILERLFEAQGAGNAIARRPLSRESDLILQAEALASHGAVLVSHWRLPGMRADSGTPVDWLAQLPGPVVHVRCHCSAAIAARRFAERRRHPGHRDGEISEAALLAGIEEVKSLGPLELGEPVVDVDTSQSPDIEAVLRDIRNAFGSGAGKMTPGV